METDLEEFYGLSPTLKKSIHLLYIFDWGKIVNKAKVKVFLFLFLYRL